MAPFTLVASDSAKLLTRESSELRIELPAGSAFNLTDDDDHVFDPPILVPTVHREYERSPDETVPEEVIDSLGEGEPLVVQVSGVQRIVDIGRLDRLVAQADESDHPLIVILKD